MKDREQERERFSARLNSALDEIGVPPKGQGRQTLVAKMFNVSQKGARKWLEAEAIPATSRLREMSQALGVSTEWLLTGDGPRDRDGVRDKNPTYNTESNVAPGPKVQGKVPLISWVQAGSAQEAIDIFQPGVADEWIPTTAPIREHTYALRVEGDSMAPRFEDGMLIIVEPDIPADNGDYVIAKNQSGETTFKRLVVDAGVMLLVPENRQYPTLRLDDGYNVIGVVRRAEIFLR